ncbi:MAG: hypothetical protein DWQ37_10500 [Planctomycetota bacterium]|nr:MAG: hypothetical protein DWQ37_10500 [Planctomycetota bacterium]
MTPPGEAASRIEEINALQDDLLRQLDELERRSAAVLAAHLPGTQPCGVPVAEMPESGPVAAGPESG